MIKKATWLRMVYGKILIHVARIQSLSSLSFVHFFSFSIFIDNLLTLLTPSFSNHQQLSALLYSVPLNPMTFAHYSVAVPFGTPKRTQISIPPSFCSTESLSSLAFTSSFSSPFPLLSKARNLSISPRINRIGLKAKVEPQESEVNLAAEPFSQFKHLLLPITDSNPYLSEGTKQAAATTAALAKKNGADITVVVIDEKQKEALPEHETQLASVRWHLSEGGFQEFKLLERLGEGSQPTAIIGEVADDMNLDLVVMSMEAIHSKHVDANLLAEFVPCPVLLLPL